jgi:tetratricopeptide (TPR) repeat protein
MRLCACLDPERRLPPEAAREIVERSDGIPLFVEEVTRSALEALLDGISPAAIPMSLHDALIARLDRLGPAYEVARLAAVIGRRFERSLLAAIAGLDAKDLDRALGILTAAGLVESGAVGAYRFRHVLIRDAAYESLLKSDRQAIHGKVARAILERFPAMRETEPDRIARHLALGGEISEAVQFWTMASEFARASGAWREAVALVEGALELIGDQPAGAAKARLRQQLERSVAGLRGLPRSAVRRSLDELWSSRLSLGEDADRFHVAFDVVNGAAMAGEIDLSVVAARLCVETAERSGDVPRRIDAYLYSGFALVLAGDLPVARRHLEQALGLYRRHEGARLSFPSMTDQLTFCLGLLLLLYHAAGEDGNAERAGLDLKAHLRDFGEPAAQILGREYLAIYALCNDAPADVRALMEEAIAVSRRNQFSDWENIDQFYMALAVAALSGRLEDAEAAERRLQTLRDFMLHNYTVHGLNEIARLRLAAGDAAGALRCIETAIAEAERMGEGLFLSPAHRTKAEILAATPGAEPAEARAALRAAIDIARAQGAEGFARRAEAFVQADRTRRCFDSPDTKINMSPRAISDHSAS